MLILADVFIRLVCALKDDTAVLKVCDQRGRHLAARHLAARHLGCFSPQRERAAIVQAVFNSKDAVVFSVLLGSVLLCGCSGDEEQARELMRQRQASRQDQGVSGSQGSDVELLAMKLSESVIAEKAEGSEAWYVSQS